MKEIEFNIDGRSYSVMLDNELASYLEEEIKKDFSRISPDGRKTLLLAYIQAKNELFELTQTIEKMLKELE